MADQSRISPETQAKYGVAGNTVALDAYWHELMSEQELGHPLDAEDAEQVDPTTGNLAWDGLIKYHRDIVRDHGSNIPEVAPMFAQVA